MLNSYFDFLVINVNIICKDILLYIFVKCFLKAKFNKKHVHIYISRSCKTLSVIEYFQLRIFIEITLVLNDLLGLIQICDISIITLNTVYTVMYL